MKGRGLITIRSLCFFFCSQFECCSTKVKQLTTQHGKMVAELSEQRKQISGKELNLERLKKELNQTKDREATQLEDRQAHTYNNSI